MTTPSVTFFTYVTYVTLVTLVTALRLFVTHVTRVTNVTNATRVTDATRRRAEPKRGLTSALRKTKGDRQAVCTGQPILRGAKS